MAVDWRQKMFDEASATVAQFIQQHPDYALDPEQPSQVEHQLNGLEGRGVAICRLRGPGRAFAESPANRTVTKCKNRPDATRTGFCNIDDPAT